MKKVISSIIIMAIWAYSIAKWALPYNKARINIAYRLYMDTTMYKEREASFGKEFAFQQFVQNGEHNFFLKKLTFLDKLKAVVVPFNYIGAMKE